MSPDAMPPLEVWGSAVSYFTGKLEGFLRWKGIPYRRLPMTSRMFERVVPRETGAAQMPAVKLPDGRWMTDTTPMIDWFEARHPEPRTIPADPVQAFASRLVEDMADEWLWRPAMHYRWSHPADARLLASLLTDEILSDVAAPRWAKRIAIQRRQTGRFVDGDGVNQHTRGHVEAVYLRMLDALQAIFARRPFLLGGAPTLADFGFFGPMFRHFASDPTPAAIMRDRAPAVWAWVARTWDARELVRDATLVEGVPEDWGPLLDEAGRGHLPWLVQNARAHAEGRLRFDARIEDVVYENVPVSTYRVWCLQRLQARLDGLAPRDRVAIEGLLDRHGCLEPLQRVVDRPSGQDPAGEAPFGRGIPVFR
ncbi:MAG: glutathione S-transferase family protein [Alphaproteobacteria bacterium]